MADPHAITPDALEILVARDLRKAGLEIGAPRRRDLSRGEAAPDEYRLALTAELAGPGSSRLLIVCRCAREPVGEDAVNGLAEGVAREADDTHSDAAVGGILVAPTFSAEALERATALRIALLRIADARASFDASGWGPRGQYPSWLPEYVLELATRDAAGMASYEMLVQGHVGRLLAATGLD